MFGGRNRTTTFHHSDLHKTELDEGDEVIGQVDQADAHMYTCSFIQTVVTQSANCVAEKQSYRSLSRASCLYNSVSLTVTVTCEVNELQQQKSTLGSTPVSSEQECDSTEGTGSPKPGR